MQNHNSETQAASAAAESLGMQVHDDHAGSVAMLVDS